MASFATGKVPDIPPDSVPTAGGTLARGVALRQAMRELGEDVKSITFN